MTNAKPENGTQDSMRIDVQDDDALRAWAKKLDATPEQVREAVQAVGDQAPDVEMHLKGSHATTNAEQEARAERLPDQA